MIRIQLQPRRRPFLPYLLLGLGVFLVGALAFSYLAREVQLSLPSGLAAVQTPAPPPVPQVELPAPPAGEALVEPVVELPARVPEPAPERIAPPAKPVPREGAPVVQPSAPPPPAKTAAALPAAGPLCLHILQLHERLPPRVRCTSLSGAAGGEYTIEGTIPAEDFPQLIALLDGLLRLPSRATMSNWREGKKEGDFAFSIHGQFAAEAPARLAPLATSEAQGLFTQAAALARKSRLDSVRVGAPLFTPVGKGVVQQRQKLWATGSYPQLKTFVETLVRQQPQLRLEEVMLVPLYKGETQWKQGQFYAVLSAPVRAAR